MICPRCQSVDFEDMGEDMWRCDRCGALVADPEVVLEGLPVLDECDT